MKCHFVFNRRRYIAPTKSEAKSFLRYFRANGYVKLNDLRTSWNIEHVELAPTWAQVFSLDIKHKIEYAD